MSCRSPAGTAGGTLRGKLDEPLPWVLVLGEKLSFDLRIPSLRSLRTGAQPHQSHSSLFPGRPAADLLSSPQPRHCGGQADHTRLGADRTLVSGASQSLASSCLASSVGVRWRPLMSVAVVTQLVTHRLRVQRRGPRDRRVALIRGWMYQTTLRFLHVC
jgi:hypothetical protein